MSAYTKFLPTPEAIVWSLLNDAEPNDPLEERRDWVADTLGISVDEVRNLEQSAAEFIKREFHRVWREGNVNSRTVD